MSLIGIPNQDQINQIISNALTNVSGLEAKTIQDIQAALQADLQLVFNNLQNFEKSAENSISQDIIEIVAEFKAMRSLLERLDGAVIKLSLGPDKVNG